MATVFGLGGESTRDSSRRFEPHVEDVGSFSNFAPLQCGHSFRRGRMCRTRRRPGVGAAAGKSHDFAMMARSSAACRSSRKEKQRWHAPDALARDAPVGAGLNHVGETFLTPRRIHFTFLIRPRCPCAAVSSFPFPRHRRFHRDEPLLGSGKITGFWQRTVRIGVLGLPCAESAASDQVDDGLIRPKTLECIRAGRYGGCLFRRHCCGVETGDFFDAGGEVLGAM